MADGKRGLIAGLTVRQPWAGLIGEGVKPYENRHGVPALDQGTYLAIQASKLPDLYRRCVEAADHKSAVGALQLKADLHGARMRPMAAIVQPGAAPASVDAWLSAQLGLGAPAALPAGGEEGEGT